MRHYFTARKTYIYEIFACWNTIAKPLFLPIRIAPKKRPILQHQGQPLSSAL
jgi:hypothetical protein